jgi:hypothetical protein
MTTAIIQMFLCWNFCVKYNVCLLHMTSYDVIFQHSPAVYGFEMIEECFARLAVPQWHIAALFPYVHYIVLDVGELFWKLLHKRTRNHVIDNIVSRY